MELPGQKAVLFSVFWGNSILFSTVAAPVCTSLHSCQECSRVPFCPQPCQHLFIDLVMVAVLTSVKWYLIVVLTRMSLMGSDAEHPFLCLWALCMSFLEKYLFRSFAHFLIGLFVFLVLSHVSSWFILEIKPLSEISLSNIFSYTVGFFFVLLVFSLAVHKLFILMRSRFILSFMPLL